MFRDDFEEGPVHSPEIVRILTDSVSFSRLTMLYRSTEELNNYLSGVTEARPLVPVYVNDICEDIIKWSEDVDDEELSYYVRVSFKERYGISVPVSIAVRDICSFGYVGTVTGEYFKRFLRSSVDLRLKRSACTSLKQFYKQGHHTIEEYYNLIEEVGATEGLAYSKKCPMRLRVKAIHLTATLVCTHARKNTVVLRRPINVNLVIMCVTLVKSINMYEDMKKNSAAFDLVVVHIVSSTMGDIRGLPKYYYLPLHILRQYMTIEPVLRKEFSKDIGYCLMLLEEVYNLNIMKLLRESPELFDKDVHEAAHELLE